MQIMCIIEQESFAIECGIHFDVVSFHSYWVKAVQLLTTPPERNRMSEKKKVKLYLLSDKILRATANQFGIGVVKEVCHIQAIRVCICGRMEVNIFGAHLLQIPR